MVYRLKDEAEFWTRIWKNTRKNRHVAASLPSSLATAREFCTLAVG